MVTELLLGSIRHCWGDVLPIVPIIRKCGFRSWFAKVWKLFTMIKLGISRFLLCEQFGGKMSLIYSKPLQPPNSQKYLFWDIFSIWSGETNFFDRIGRCFESVSPCFRSLARPRQKRHTISDVMGSLIPTRKHPRFPGTIPDFRTARERNHFFRFKMAEFNLKF